MRAPNSALSLRREPATPVRYNGPDDRLEVSPEPRLVAAPQPSALAKRIVASPSNGRVDRLQCSNGPRSRATRPRHDGNSEVRSVPTAPRIASPGGISLSVAAEARARRRRTMGERQVVDRPLGGTPKPQGPRRATLSTPTARVVPSSCTLGGALRLPARGHEVSRGVNLPLARRIRISSPSYVVLV